MKARLLVGRNLRRLRVGRGYSQETLGLAAGCEPSYVGRIERGRENPTVDLLELLATKLDAGISDLFDHAGTSYVPRNLQPGRKRKVATDEAGKGPKKPGSDSAKKTPTGKARRTLHKPL